MSTANGFLGVKIPPTNLQGYHLDEARAFAGHLADQLTETDLAA